MTDEKTAAAQLAEQLKTALDGVAIEPVCKASGLSRSSLYRVMGGESGVSLEVLMAIARAFGLVVLIDGGGVSVRSLRTSAKTPSRPTA